MHCLRFFFAIYIRLTKYIGLSMHTILTGFLVTLLISFEFETNLAFTITESQAFSDKILIPLVGLLTIILMKKFHSEPIVENFLQIIKATLSGKMKFTLSLSASMALAGFITGSPYALATSGLTLIFGITLYYFYWCTNFFLNRMNGNNI